MVRLPAGERLELAGVGSDHGRARPRTEDVGSAEAGDAVCIENDRSVHRIKDAFGELPSAGAEAGPEHDDVEPIGVLGDVGDVTRREPGAGADGPGHDPGAGSRRDLGEAARVGHRHRTRPHLEGRSRRQHRGAADPRRSANDEDRPRRPLVRGAPPRRSRGIAVFAHEELRHAAVQTDVDDVDGATALRPLPEEMSRLEGMERHCALGLERPVGRMTGRGVEPRGHVHGEHRRRHVEPGRDRVGQRAAESDAKERIDDEIGGDGFAEGRHRDAGAGRLGAGSGRGRSGAGRAEGADRHGAATPEEVARRDVAVAAVVPRAGEHDHAGAV